MATDTNRVIVALDNMTLFNAVLLADVVINDVAGVKVGSELLCDEGAGNIMQALSSTGLRVFFDPKTHDIPNTAAKTVRRLARRKAWIINVHCSGGREMMEASRKAVDEVWKNEREELGLTHKPLLIGVTILTSLNLKALVDVGFVSHPEYQNTPETRAQERIQALVLQLTILARNSGLDGVVCSPQEIEAIRQSCGPKFQIITPGIRLEGGEANDQSCVATPAGAIESGADWLVVGRPITEAKDPLATLKLINQQVADALAKKKDTV